MDLKKVDSEGDLVFDSVPVMVQGEQLRDAHGELLFEKGDLIKDENGDPTYEKLPVYGADVQKIDGEGNPVFKDVPVYTQVQKEDEDGNLVFDQILSTITRYKIVGYETKNVDLKVYYSGNEQVTVNGYPTQGKMPVYVGVVTDSFIAHADIVNQNGELQTQIDQTGLGYPAKLFLPVIKILNGDIEKVSNEVYMSASLVNGKLQATGKFPEAGNWILNADRVNNSLAEIGTDWKIVMDDLSFRIAEKVD